MPRQGRGARSRLAAAVLGLLLLLQPVSAAQSLSCDWCDDAHRHFPLKPNCRRRASHAVPKQGWRYRLKPSPRPSVCCVQADARTDRCCNRQSVHARGTDDAEAPDLWRVVLLVHWLGLCGVFVALDLIIIIIL